MSAARPFYWPQQQQTCWHRPPLNGHGTVLVDEVIRLSSARTHGSQKAPNPDYTVVGQYNQTLQRAPWSFRLVWGLASSCCRRKTVFFSGLALEFAPSVKSASRCSCQSWWFAPICADEWIEALLISWADSCAGPPGTWPISSLSSLLKSTTHHLTVLTSTVWSP
jgi:hypothetical protein